MRVRLPVPLALVLLLGPGVLACFAGGYFDRPRLVAGVLAWLALAAVAVLDPAPLPRSGPARAAVAGLALLTAWTGLSLTWAPLAGPAADDLQRLLVYLPALAAGVAVFRAPAARRLVEPLLLLAVTGATGYGLAERLAPGVVQLDGVVSAGDRLAYPLSYWNATGAFAAMGLVLAAGLAGDPGRSRALRAAAAAAGPPLGLAVYLTFSRGALGALLAGLMLLLALAPSRVQLRAAAVVTAGGAVAALATLVLPAVARTGDGSAAQGAAMLALLAGLMAVAVAAALQAPAEATRAPVPRLRAVALCAFVLTLAGSVATVAGAERRGGRDAPEAGAGRLASVQSNRYEYWRVALRTFGDHPLRGIGSGGFRTAWLRERSFQESVRDAHSLYLETPAELGLIGLALLALMLAGVATGAARAVRRAGPVAAPATAALAAWALHAGLDWDWEMPALTLVALALAARLLAAGEPGPSGPAATARPAA